MIIRLLTLLSIGTLAGVTVAYASSRSTGHDESASPAFIRPVAPSALQQDRLAAKDSTTSTRSKASSKANSPAKDSPVKTTKKAPASSQNNQNSQKDAPAVSRTPAEQVKAKEKVDDLTTTQKGKMLTLLNEGSETELATIRGISSTRAAAIEKARPFENIEEVVLVRGIGETTFAQVIDHARSLTQRSSESETTKTESKSSSPSKTTASKSKSESKSESDVSEKS